MYDTLSVQVALWSLSFLAVSCSVVALTASILKVQIARAYSRAPCTASIITEGVEGIEA